MEELKSLLKMTDEVSENLKLNGLKFINSICNDKNIIDKFLNANGEDLINNIIKYELKNFAHIPPRPSSYIVMMNII
jgi:hypothetical protein